MRKFPSVLFFIFCICFYLLQVQNNLTMSLDIFCKSQALKAIPELAIKAELDDDKGYVKLTTVGSGESYQVPMLIAYHCELFVTPSDLA